MPSAQVRVELPKGGSMDAITAAGSFATIIGLLADFVAQRADQKSAELSEFTEWLRRNGHEKTLASIKANHETAISIEAALAEGHRQLLARLLVIERELSTRCEQHGPFGQLARSLYPRIPSDLLEHIRPGVSSERVRDVLGAAHKIYDNTWWYRCPEALIQIEFSERAGASSVVLALTLGAPSSWFIIPMFGRPLGSLSLADVFEEDGKFRYRSTLRTEELLFETRIGPPGAEKNYTFGVLRPLAPGSLADVNFDWDYNKKELRSDPRSVIFNWIGLSESTEELWFDWSLALP